MIYAIENSTKFQKTRFWKEKKTLPKHMGSQTFIG
jgi:hypothetical protein